MLVNIQFEEAATLLWELHAAIPQDRRAEFSERVNQVSALLHHPGLGADANVFVAIGRDGADESAIALRSVVRPV